MALIPPFFLDCVVSIGTQAKDKTLWFGTGFIVGRLLTDENGKPILNNNGQKTYHTILVTNKHVLNNPLVTSNQHEILVRFNTQQGSQVKDYAFQLQPNGNPIWVGHNSSEVDVAAFYINPDNLKIDEAVLAFFDLSEQAMSVSDMQKNGLSEGDSLFVLGFPMGIVGSQSNHTIARSGSIARIRDLFNRRESSFLIDANIFPGNSGGPVVIRPELMTIDGTNANQRAALIGVVKQYFAYSDTAISQQTGRPRITFEENSGLAPVETVDSIRDTVELCYQQIEKLKD